ncbi:MAG TPA: hypothetical protein VGG39_08975 [Polyangiaceae bacterium]|jgi:hypothetical protein
MTPALVRTAGRVAALAAIPTILLLAVSPLLLHPWTLGQHNWDQMSTQREVVVKTLAHFHQFPFWDPYTCGGHPAWGSLESDPIVVSPWLPFYFLVPLAIAIRIEIVGWAIVGAAGCWRLASRFTQSWALRSLFTVVSLLNSRWGMQIGAGHTWHLLYGLLPWALFFFDRSIEAGAPRQRARRDTVLAGVIIATMVYGDGIYPVPHTAMALGIYALVLARSTRSWRPVQALGWVGATAMGLAAPKLLPLSEALLRFPRIIKSDEAMWPQYLYGIFTWREGDYAASGDFVVGMWHEWGLYLGWPALVGLVAAVVASRGPRERALKWAGLVMCSFVLGGFHPLMPWSLLHLLPIFKSQHVPSRWLYTAVILLACAGVSGADRWLRRFAERRPRVEAALGFAAVLLAIQMGTVTRVPIAQSFVNPIPADPDRETPFRMVHRLPPRPDYVAGLWDVATLPGVYDNVGTLECDTDNGLHITHRDAEDRMPGVGAFGETDPPYRGETYDAERIAPARIVSWTPNDVVVQIEGAHAGDHLVLNQNWDAGWSANGAPAIPYRDAVAAVLGGPSATVDFRYAPRTLWWGVLGGALSLAAIAFALTRKERA